MSPSPKSPPDPHIFRECNWRAHASVDVRRPAGRPRWCSWSSAAVRNPYVIRDCGLARTAPDCRRAGLPNRLPTLVWLSDRLELAGPGGLGCPSRPEQSTGAQTIGCLPMERGHAGVVIRSTDSQSAQTKLFLTLPLQPKRPFTSNEVYFRSLIVWTCYKRQPFDLRIGPFHIRVPSSCRREPYFHLASRGSRKRGLTTFDNIIPRWPR
jgi:hypothetical protein